jgi:hypothetical protein
MKRILTVLFTIGLLAASPVMAQDNKWVLVTGTDNLRTFMSGLTAERELAKGETSKAIYNADGTGTLRSWGATIQRTWSVKGEDQVCVNERRVIQCFNIEQNTTEANQYRARMIKTGDLIEFRVANGHGVVNEGATTAGPKGGAAAPSADELAAELSNPNTAVATLTFKNQFRWFEGDLPDADGQSSYALLFQPGLPFVLESGDKIIWRPAIPIFVDKPMFDPVTGEFSGETGLGDIAFDLAYAPKTDPSLMLGFGLITSLPTATNDLGTDRFTLGPEVLLGKLTPKYVLGLFPNHQWDIGGSGEADINLTTIQAFFTYLPGGGWTVGSAPIMTYDWEGEQWTVPLQINAGKTVVWGGRPWKLSVELNYYVEKADAFGPEWMLSFNIAPVVKNGLASLFGLSN